MPWRMGIFIIDRGGIDLDFLRSTILIISTPIISEYGFHYGPDVWPIRWSVFCPLIGYIPSDREKRTRHLLPTHLSDILYVQQAYGRTTEIR